MITEVIFANAHAHCTTLTQMKLLQEFTSAILDLTTNRKIKFTQKLLAIRYTMHAFSVYGPGDMHILSITKTIVE